MSTPIEVVFLDIGGPLYDDSVYAQALYDTLRELSPPVTRAQFDDAYLSCQRGQSGFTGPIADHFEVDHHALAEGASRRWRYPSDALWPDVLPTLEELRRRYRIGLLANQPAAVRATLERDGLASQIDLWAISGEVGLAKPGPEIFAYAAELAVAAPERIVFVGNRLDNDIRPARAAGWRTVWLLRGEAPPDPDPAQLACADVAIRSLSELSTALRRLESSGRV